MPGKQNRPRAASETFLGSATSRAVEEEKQRLGAPDEPADRIEIWGRRVGRCLAIAAIAAAVAWAMMSWSSASAQDYGEERPPLTEHDQGRMSRLEKSREAGLRQAQDGEPEQYEAVRELLESPAQPIMSLRELSGSWRCRTIKLGGGLPLTVYGYFGCRIIETERGLVFEKPTGSQRKRGLLFPQGEGRMLYAGTSYYSYNKPLPYGSGPDVDEVGLLVRIGPDHLRLELPEPRYESKHDVIELVRD